MDTISYCFVWDGLIIIKDNNYDNVMCVAKEYIHMHGNDHNYYLYTIVRHDIKGTLLKEC